MLGIEPRTEWATNPDVLRRRDEVVAVLAPARGRRRDDLVAAMLAADVPAVQSTASARPQCAGSSLIDHARRRGGVDRVVPILVDGERLPVRAPPPRSASTRTKFWVKWARA